MLHSFPRLEYFDQLLSLTTRIFVGPVWISLGHLGLLSPVCGARPPQSGGGGGVGVPWRLDSEGWATPWEARLERVFLEVGWVEPKGKPGQPRSHGFGGLREESHVRGRGPSDGGAPLMEVGGGGSTGVRGVDVGLLWKNKGKRGGIATYWVQSGAFALSSPGEGGGPMGDLHWFLKFRSRFVLVL